MDQLEQMKIEGLPESINLHSMIIQSVSMDSDPQYINTGMHKQLLSEEIRTRFELVDPINRTEVTVTITKTVQHQLKD